MVNIFSSAMLMPCNLARLLRAVAMNRFDPLVGYPYAMAITSALAQRFCKVRIGNDFESEVSLYFLTIAPSGSGKGTMWKGLFSPIEQLIKNKHEEEEHENIVRQGHNDALQCIIGEKKKQVRRLSGNALNLLLQEIAELNCQKKSLVPKYKFDVQDVTTASLLAELSQQEDHSLLIADTEGRFIRSLDEDKMLAGMLNQAYVGESISNSRASGNSHTVANPHLSIAMAIQPEKLERLKKNPNLWGEGFFARILPYYSCFTAPQDQAVGEITDASIIRWWQAKIASLFNMPTSSNAQGASEPLWIELDMDARYLFDEEVKLLQRMKSSTPYAGFQGVYARMPEQIARIAAIYHILEQADPFSSRISGQVMQLAIGACRFFLEQAQRLYAEFNPDPLVKLLPKVCGWLKSREGSTSYVTAKDIYHGVGCDKSGLTRTINHLLSLGVLFHAVEYKRPPNFNAWNELKSYGFGINFALLSRLPD